MKNSFNFQAKFGRSPLFHLNSKICISIILQYVHTMPQHALIIHIAVTSINFGKLHSKIRNLISAEAKPVHGNELNMSS